MATEQTYILDGPTDFFFPFPVRTAGQIVVSIEPGGVLPASAYEVIGASATATGVTIRYADAPRDGLSTLRIQRRTEFQRVSTFLDDLSITARALNAEFDNILQIVQDGVLNEFRGDWETERLYFVLDVVRAPDGSLFVCIAQHQSDDFDADLAAERWLLVADFATGQANIDAALQAAEAARDKAEQWAEEDEDVEVEPSQFSAKHYSIKASDSAAAALISEQNAAPVNAIVSEITTVAGIESDVIVVAGINSEVVTVAGIDSEVATVSGIAGDVITVAANDGDITIVATNVADVNTVATNVVDVNTTAASIANVNTVAGDIANVNIVAGDIADVNTVANNIFSVLAVEANESNINTVAAQIGTVIDAVDAKIQAFAAADRAMLSEAGAAGHEAAAAQSAKLALDRANDADLSAQNAATSETNADGFAQAASGSATAADLSAQDADGFAQDANESAQDAETSAQAANQSRINAEAAQAAVLAATNKGIEAAIIFGGY